MRVDCNSSQYIKGRGGGGNNSLKESLLNTRSETSGKETDPMTLSANFFFLIIFMFCVGVTCSCLRHSTDGWSLSSQSYYFPLIFVLFETLSCMNGHQGIRGTAVQLVAWKLCSTTKSLSKDFLLYCQNEWEGKRRRVKVLLLFSRGRTINGEQILGPSVRNFKALNQCQRPTLNHFFVGHNLN